MNLDKIIKNVNVNKLKYKNTNMTYEQVLKQEVHRFKDILQKHIEDYYESYTPKVYKRKHFGGNLLESLTVDDIVKISGNGKQWTCSVLINEKAIHESMFESDQHETNVFWMLDSGWSVREGKPFSDIYRLGYYEGAHFVDSAIEEFNNTNKYGITIQVNRPLVWY